MRQSLYWATASALLTANLCWAQPGPAIIPQSEASRHGLNRSWVVQIGLDRARDRLADVKLHGDGLFVLTERGRLQALDAETGATRWVSQIGRPDHPNMPLAVNDDFLAVINGSQLHVVSRQTGEPVFERRLRFIPNAAPALCPNWVCCPSLSGNLEVINLEDPKRNWTYSSFGRIDVQPLVTPQHVVWSTDRGYIQASSHDRPNVRFRLQTGEAVSAPMSYWPPLVIAASRDGYVYAMNETTGDIPWKFSVGTAINEPPVVAEGAVYANPESGGMHALSVETGLEQWFAPGVEQVLAISPTRIYAADAFGDTVALDVKTGGRLDKIATSRLTWKVTNTQNDRLYLATTDGLLTCLHELQLAEPVLHTLPDLGPGDETDPAAPGAGDPAAPPAAVPPVANPFNP